MRSDEIEMTYHDFMSRIRSMCLKMVQEEKKLYRLFKELKINLTKNEYSLNRTLNQDVYSEKETETLEMIRQISFETANTCLMIERKKDIFLRKRFNRILFVFLTILTLSMIMFWIHSFPLFFFGNSIREGKVNQPQSSSTSTGILFYSGMTDKALSNEHLSNDDDLEEMFSLGNSLKLFAEEIEVSRLRVGGTSLFTSPLSGGGIFFFFELFYY
jgi:hypothetical protein